MSLIPPPNAPRAITYQRAHFVGAVGRAAPLSREPEGVENEAVQVSLSARGQRQAAGDESTPMTNHQLPPALAVYAAVQALDVD